MTTTMTQPVSLKVSRLIKAPRERVYAAWTTPSDIMKWLGGGCCQFVSAKMDVRVGGDYSFLVKSEKSGESEIRGTYRELNPPGRLAFTWNTGGCAGDMEKTETVVTVDLLERQGGTEVVISHDLFTSEESRDRHQEGWTASLVKLEKLS
jgi:uncharacterized protein YndB with AHSA1/START domain